MEEFEIHHADAGSEEKSSIPVNKLKKGGYVIIEDRPCRVVDIAKSKTGKHGHAKASIAGSDIFTGRRYETHLPTSHDIEIPFVDRSEYALLNIDGKHTQLLALNNEIREDVEMPVDEEMFKRVTELFATGDEVLVTVLSCNSESAIIDCKKKD